MQGQRGAIGSFPETLGFEHGSSASNNASVVDQQNSQSNYVSPANQEEQNVSMCNVGESSMLSLGDHVNNGDHASSSSFSDPFELDDRRLSRKRKAVELTAGQSSSGIGSPNMFQRPEGGSTTRRAIAENPLSDQMIPRLGLGVGGVSSENLLGENARRNVQLRINSSHQQDPLPLGDDDDDNNNNNYNRESDLRSPPVAATSENSSSRQGQSFLRIPALRRNFQSTSRWSRNSSSRAHRSSSNPVISENRNELDSISDHPLFAQPSTIRNSGQTEVNWSSNGGGRTVNTAGTGPAPSAAPSSAANRGSPHYHPRRLSAFLRRSLLSATDSEAGSVQNSNLFPRIIPPGLNGSASSQDLGVPPVVGIQDGHHHHQPHLRSSVLVGRQLEGAFGLPYLSRSMMAGSEVRGRLVSEIRNVLDLMRRGEPLRFEDVMILDQSMFYGISDIHDRHRDMRLDIDNMSYEELLALEERIGNVNTGLAEEKISKHLKEKQHVAVIGQPDAEPCCICQEEYKDGDDLGGLECGHEFHRGCIKQWLQHKNSCPICKSTGLLDSK